VTRRPLALLVLALLAPSFSWVPTEIPDYYRDRLDGTATLFVRESEPVRLKQLAASFSYETSGHNVVLTQLFFLDVAANTGFLTVQARHYVTPLGNCGNDSGPLSSRTDGLVELHRQRAWCAISAGPRGSITLFPIAPRDDTWAVNISPFPAALAVTRNPDSSFRVTLAE